MEEHIYTTLAYPVNMPLNCQENKISIVTHGQLSWKLQYDATNI